MQTHFTLRNAWGQMAHNLRAITYRATTHNLSKEQQPQQEKEKEQQPWLSLPRLIGPRVYFGFISLRACALV